MNGPKRNHYNPKDIFRLENLRKKAFQKIGSLEVTGAVTHEPVPPEKRSGLVFKDIKPGTVWGKKMYNCAWFHFTGAVPDAYKKEHVLLHINVGGEGLAYKNSGDPYEMTSIKISFIDFLSMEKGKSMIELSDDLIRNGAIDFYMDAGFNGTIMSLPFGIGVFQFADIVVQNDIYYDIYHDYLSVASLRASLGEDDKEKIDTALDKAYSLIMSGKTEKAEEVLSSYIDSEPLDFTLYAVGHSHLDLAWLWPIRETKRKSVRTFTKQMNNIEKHSSYIYGASQPWQFEYLKNNEPIVFEKIRSNIQSGRIEPQGGMYVEADTNLSGGEALVRQFYFGRKFFSEEFGKDMEICWLPDVFGYNGNLPQIMKKSDIPYFFTIKLSWNEHNLFPHRSFNWSGIDSSQVLVHMAPDEDYNSDGSPVRTRRAYQNYPEKDVSKEALFVYGVGDGGGGPSDVFIELLERQKKMYKTPKVQFSPAIDFFKKLETYKDKLPSYSGELYLEKHQGTYTTQGRNKRFNRKSEYALEDIETLSSIAYLRGREYNSEKINEWWKEILLYQFHDIIPGSSIGRVYTESRARYETILSEIEEEKKDILRFLCGEGDKLLAYNPTSFERSEIIGDKCVSVEPFACASLGDYTEKPYLLATNSSIANKNLTVLFADSGEIVSLRDKEGTEYSKEYLNRLKLFFDKPLYFNAWDIDWKYHNKEGQTLKAFKHTVRNDGTSVTRTNYFRHGKTVLRQEISLGANDDFVTVKTFADWHELFMMLRAESVPSVFSNEVSCDIQYGTIKRTTRDETLIEKAQFEICAHKYVDVSDESRGFSLLNDSKYGHRVKNGLISLNLLRSPVFPDPKADRGLHEFTYVLYPHKGSLSADTLKRAYALNKPLYVFSGSKPLEPIIRSTNQNIVIELVKKAYTENALTVRMFESQGISEKTELEIMFEHSDVFETNLLEENPKAVDTSNLEFSPYEIKTIKIKL